MERKKKLKSVKKKSRVGKKSKPLPASMRAKKRYIYFQLSSARPIHPREVNFAVTQTFFSLYGSQGSAKMHLQLIEFSPENGKGILRCTNEMLEEAKTGLLFLQSVQNIAVKCTILKVSGTLKKLRGKRKK